jgi:hypothetical protein
MLNSDVETDLARMYTLECGLFGCAERNEQHGTRRRERRNGKRPRGIWTSQEAKDKAGCGNARNYFTYLLSRKYQASC